MKSLVKVAVLDSHDISRHGIVALLEKAVSEVQLTHILTDGTELEHTLSEHLLDVLLLDDGFLDAGDIHRIVSQVQRLSPLTRIMVLSLYLQTAYLQQLFREGVSGFLYKGEQCEDLLLPGIRRVIQGELYLSPRAASLPYRDTAQPELATLTPRDLQVLRMLQDDLTVKEIADALNLDSQTVYRSRNKLRDALGVRTNENIVPIAQERGLL